MGREKNVAVELPYLTLKKLKGKSVMVTEVYDYLYYLHPLLVPMVGFMLSVVLAAVVLGAIGMAMKRLRQTPSGMHGYPQCEEFITHDKLLFQHIYRLQRISEAHALLQEELFYLYHLDSQGKATFSPCSVYGVIKLHEVEMTHTTAYRIFNVVEDLGMSMEYLDSLDFKEGQEAERRVDAYIDKAIYWVVINNRLSGKPSGHQKLCIYQEGWNMFFPIDHPRSMLLKPRKAGAVKLSTVLGSTNVNTKYYCDAPYHDLSGNVIYQLKPKDHEPETPLAKQYRVHTGKQALIPCTKSGSYIDGVRLPLADMSKYHWMVTHLAKAT